MSTANDPDTQSPTMRRTGPAGSAEVIPCHDATTLTAGGSVAHIWLNRQSYVLRITRQGKLILTK